MKTTREYIIFLDFSVKWGVFPREALRIRIAEARNEKTRSLTQTRARKGASPRDARGKTSEKQQKLRIDRPRETLRLPDDDGFPFFCDNTALDARLFDDAP